MTDPIARVVADADVLAADCLTGGASREAMDRIRAHGWIDLVASDALLADAEAVIRELADDAIATDWRETVTGRVTVVDHPRGDHPAIASALHGDARHVLSLDDALTGAQAAAAIRRDADVETSVKPPDAFVRLFDPASIYETVHDDAYPGPDRDPRG